MPTESDPAGGAASHDSRTESSATARDFLDLLGDLREKDTLSDEEFERLLALGRRTLSPGAGLSPERRAELLRYRVGSIGEGEDEIVVLRLLSKGRHGGDPLRDRFEMTLRLDRSGAMTRFFWDRPIAPDAEEVVVEQLGMFLAYVRDNDFPRMASKGKQLFRKGRHVPDHAKLLAGYPSEVTADSICYTLYSISGPAGGEQVRLYFEPGSDVVKQFLAVSYSR